MINIVICLIPVLVSMKIPFFSNKGVINSVEKLYVLRKGITWAVGVQNELFRLDENRFPATESVQLYTGKIENNIGDSIYIVMQDKDGDEWILTNKGATIVGKKSMANLMPFKFMVENADDIYLATSKAFLPDMTIRVKMLFHVSPMNLCLRLSD